MGNSRRVKRVGKGPSGHLPCAKHHGISRNQPLFLTRCHLQTLGNDPPVGHSALHLHALCLQAGAVNPPRRLAQPPPRLFCLALQKHDLARGRPGLWPTGGKAARTCGRIPHAPFPTPQRRVQRGAFALMHQDLCHIKTDSPGPDHGHPPPHRRTAQHVDIAQHIWPVLPRNAGIARQDPGCDDHLFKTAKVIHGCLAPKPQVDPGLADHRREPVHQAVEFLFAGHLLCQVQLPAQV